MMTIPRSSATVDLAPIAKFLDRNGQGQVDMDRLELRYLKLALAGPTLALLEAPTPAGPNAVVVARWTGQAKGERWAERINQRSRVVSAGRQPSALKAAAVYGHELGILFSEFPFDRRLPSLPAVVDDAIMLGRLRPALEDHFKGVLESVTPRLIRYRPEGKCVLRFDLKWALQRERLPLAVFGKVAKASIFERSRPTLGRLSAVLGTDGFVIPAPIAIMEDLSLEVFSALGGVPMTEVLGRPDQKDLGARTGQALRSFHETVIDLPSRPMAEKTDLATDNAAQLAAHLPHRSTLIAEFSREILSRLDSYSGTALQLTHHDFHTANVMVGGGPLGLIDFEETSMGDPADDVGAMIAHLEAATLTSSSRPLCIRETSRRFVDAYDISCMSDRVGTYAALHTMLLGYQALRYPSPTSLDQAEHLLLQAHHLLAGGLQ